MADRLQILRDYFPTAIYTGRALIFISEDFRVEMTEHIFGGFSGPSSTPVIRVKLFAKSASGEFEPGHYEDFAIQDISDLAGEIEKFVQHSLGKNIRES